MRDWAKVQVEANNVDFVGLVDLHSYSQQILFPYAYTCGVEPPNIEKMEELALGLAKSIRLFSGESYSVKAACRGAVTDSNTEKALRIEPTGGSAIDWFYHELGAHYSYQIKLRDTGSYGFLLPSDQIIPTGVCTSLYLKTTNPCSVLRSLFCRLSSVRPSPMPTSPFPMTLVATLREEIYRVRETFTSNCPLLAYL